MELRDIAALSILAEILGSDTGRLREKLVLTGIARDAGADVETGFTGRFSVFANAVNVDGLARVESAVADTIAELLEKGVTQDELDLERAQFLAGEIQLADYQALLASRYGSALALDWDIEFIEEWITQIKAVTVGDVNAVAGKYLVEELKVTGEALPPAAASAPGPLTGKVK